MIRKWNSQDKIQSKLRQRVSSRNHNVFKNQSPWFKLISDLQKPAALIHTDKANYITHSWLVENGKKLGLPAQPNVKTIADYISSQIRQKIESRAGCLTYAHKSRLSVSEAEKIVNKDEQELIALIYANTLSHEIGHVLGLTHNFQGSYDKEHFHFPDESESGRLYSSIMDYNDTDHSGFHGMGPYDVAALRFGYVGRIPLKNGQEIQLSQLKKALKLGHWHEFNENHLQLLIDNGVNLDKFMYCTDIHVGSDLTCMPFDRGSNPIELVNHYKQSYEQLFTLSGYPHDRISGVSLGKYLSRVIQNFILIRSFLDEAIWKAVLGFPDASEFLKAAFESYKTFMNVINRPTITLPFNAKERFLVMPYSDQQGQQKLAVIETRPLPIWIDFTGNFEIKQMGYEIDKALAVQFLTAHVFDNLKYEMANLSLNYVHFENLVLGLEPSNSLILGHLLSGLKEQPSGYYFLEDNTMLPMTNLEMTSLMKNFYLLAPTIFLKTASVSMNWDMSQNFRMFLGTDKSLPQLDTDAIVLPLTQKGPYKNLKIAAVPEASHAHAWLRYLEEVRRYLKVDEWISIAEQAWQVAPTSTNCGPIFCLENKSVQDVIKITAQK